MKKPGKVSHDVPLSDIPLILTVDEWFDKYQFARKTGMMEFSCNSRLYRLYKDDCLTRQKGESRPIKYKMTEENKQRMLDIVENKEASKGRRKRASKKQKLSAEDIAIAKTTPFNKLLLSTQWI